MKKLNQTLLLLVTLALIGVVYLVTKSQTVPKDDIQAKKISYQTPTGGGFTLQSSHGEVSLKDFRNKLVFVYFGYTFCPDICPVNLGHLSIAYQALSEAEKQKVQIIFVSIDPKRDTPKRLAEYTHYFNANILGLTSDTQTLKELTRRYGAVYETKENPKNKQKNYAVDHTGFTYMIDFKGQLKRNLPHATLGETYIKVIRNYLQQNIIIKNS